MGIVIDIILIAILALGIYAGQKKGLIKSLVSLIGLVSIVIISYYLKKPVANFLIDKIPFFNILGGLTSLNILLFDSLSFIVVFVVLYCVYLIVLSLTKFVDTLLKFTVIWAIPSKIGGAIIGFLEAWVYLFLILFLLSHFNVTAGYLKDSKVAGLMLNHTPVIGNVLGRAVTSAQEIYDKIGENIEDKSIEKLNLDILSIEINHGIISKEKATELIETGKIVFEQNVMFGKGKNLWLNT